MAHCRETWSELDLAPPRFTSLHNIRHDVYPDRYKEKIYADAATEHGDMLARKLYFAKNAEPLYKPLDKHRANTLLSEVQYQLYTLKGRDTY